MGVAVVGKPYSHMRPLYFAAIIALPGMCRADDLDVAVQRQMAKDRCPGLSLAVVRNGEIVRLSSYGVANLEWMNPTTVDTRFEIASVSKMVTGAAFRCLVEDGKVGLDDSLAKYFDGLPESWKSIRVRHLITMSTGFPEDFGSELIPYNKDVVEPSDDASLLALFAKLPFVSPIGTRFSYSSANYALMGLIISKVSGMPYAQYMRQRVFEPAGMTDTSVIDNTAVVSHRASGYRMEGGRVKHGRFLGQYLHSRADDSILTTARDLAKFVIALEKRKIAKDLDKLWEATVSDTGVPLDYAYGWISGTMLGHREIGHTGNYRTGFRSFVARFPDDGLSIVVLTNCNFSDVDAYKRIITRKYLKGLLDPETESGKPDPNPEQTERAIAAVTAIKGGKVDSSLMVNDEALLAGMKGLSELLQPVQEWSYAGHGVASGLSVNGHRLISFTSLQARMTDEVHYITVYFEPGGKVARIEPTR